MMNQAKRVEAIAMGLTILSSLCLSAKGATVVHVGTVEIGAEGNTRFSFIHTAESHQINPLGTHAQRTNGTVVALVDPTMSFVFNFGDDPPTELSPGDTIVFDDVTIPLREYTGTLLNPTMQGVIGSMTINGTLTVGSTVAAHASMDYTLGGPLTDDIPFDPRG